MRTGALNKLTATQAKAAAEGMHSDGGGLFLRVKGNTRSWVFRFTSDGRKREMGLGAAVSVTLAEARRKAAEARSKVSAGQDPIETRATVRPERKRLTFEDAFRRHLADHSPTWRNPKHRQQWENTVLTYATALLPLPVEAIGPGEVADVLSPIWLAKPETASRLRGRIEAVLGSCIARGERPGPNPAALRDNLAHILPRQRAEVQHHAAIAVEDAPGAFARLWQKRGDGMGYQVLVTLCLTAMRSGEARGLRWDEVGESAITIPKERMKAKRPHVLPLTPRLKDHLASQARWVGTNLLHPGQSGRMISDMTATMAMRRSGLGEFTVHGWRSTFRDWAGREGFARELAEYQLAHAVGTEVERAYARDSLVERRRPMMEAWEGYLWKAL